MAAGGWRLVDGWEAVGAVLWVQGETAARRCCCTRLPRREHGAALRATSCAVRAVPMAMVMGQQLLGHRRRQQVRRTTHRSMAQPAVPSRQRLNGNVAPRLGAPMARDPSVSSSSLSRAVHVVCSLAAHSRSSSCSAIGHGCEGPRFTNECARHPGQKRRSCPGRRPRRRLRGAVSEQLVPWQMLARYVHPALDVPNTHNYVKQGTSSAACPPRWHPDWLRYCCSPRRSAWCHMALWFTRARATRWGQPSDPLACACVLSAMVPLDLSAAACLVPCVEAFPAASCPPRAVSEGPCPSLPTPSSPPGGRLRRAG